jgi:hypothetical protein
MGKLLIMVGLALAAYSWWRSKAARGIGPTAAEARSLLGVGEQADPARKLREGLADPAHVARLDVLHAVAQHHPIDARTAKLRPLGAAVPDQLCVEAGPTDPVGFRVDLADEVEIDETVVDRRDQRVGTDHRCARVGIIAPGCVHHDDIDILRHALEGGLDRLSPGRIKGIVERHRQLGSGALHCRGTVVEVAAKGSLARVEIERAHAAALRCKSNRGVNRGGRLAGSAFLVGEDDEMRGRHGHG